MCTKYSLKDDNPDVFKKFIPRNLSRTDLSSDDFETRYGWCLMPNGGDSDCSCQFPKLSKLINFRMSRKSVFIEKQVDESNGFFESSEICKNSLSYFPSDIDFTNDNRRSKSQVVRQTEKCRKSVRFADALGLQLSEIKFIKNSDSEKAPILTSSAIKDLHLDHNCHLAMQGIKYFCPCFKIDEKSVIVNTVKNKIQLEKAFIQGMTLFGRISVKNISYEKNVGIRITFNNWLSFKDIYASYILESTNGIIDKFSFSVNVPRSVIVGSKIEFAVFYLTQNGETFWDNNLNQNYVLECFAKNMGIVTDDGWMHFL